MKSRRKPRPHRGIIRGTAVGATVVAASAAMTMGISAWPAEGQPRAAEPSVTRIGDLPAAASVARGDKPAGQALAGLRAHQRRQAARAAAEARARRQAARRSSRSASRTVHYAGDPRRIARAMMAQRYGWGSGEFSCLDSLWTKESGWNVHAANPSSSAYGIPQALPGSKMAAYGSDWANNPVTQIEWGLAYIHQSYGTPCNAWASSRAKGYY